MFPRVQFAGPGRIRTGHFPHTRPSGRATCVTRVAQVFDPRNLLPYSCGECVFLMAPESSPIRQSWKLRMELRRTQSADTVGNEETGRCARQLFAATPGRGSVFVVKGFEVGGGGCFNDRSRRASKECFGRRPAATASWNVAWMRGLAATSAPRCVRAAMSRAGLR